MKKQFRKYLAVLLAAMTLLTVFALPASAAEKEEGIPHGTVISEDDPSFAQIEENLTLPPAAEDIVSSAPPEVEKDSVPELPEETANSLPEESAPTESLVRAPQRAADEKPTHTEQQHAPNLRLLSIGQTELSATVVQDTSWHVHGSVVYRIKQTDGGSWSEWAETNTFTGLTPGVQYTIGAKYLPTLKEETYYITNYTESEETTRTVKTAATDQYIVTSEEELRELLASAPSVTERNYISVFNGKDITITQPLTIPALPEGKRLVFDLNGFTVSSTARGAAPLFTVQGDATVDNGTIKTDNSLTAIKIDSAGSLYLRDMTINAGTALENHGTIVGMGNVRFAGGTGLVNYGAVEASSKFSGTQTDSSRPLVDNYGSITVLDLDCKTQCLDSIAVHNNTGATIGTLSGTVSYSSINSNDFYGTEAAENADGLLRNDGTIDVLCAAFTSRGGVSVSNYDTIKTITDGAKLTANGNKDYPSIALANQQGGKIEEIKGGNLTGYASALVNYGEISHISGGYFQHSSGENVSNYGTIQDISSGGFQSASGYKWADKKYFIVNHDGGSYTFRNGYSVSQSPITYDDGTTSGQWRMVGKAHTVSWTGMDNKLTLYLAYGLDTHYEKKVGVTGQYVGSDFVQTFVEGETVSYYGYDRDRNASLQKYVLLADKDNVSLNLQRHFGGSIYAPTFDLSEIYTEIPRGYHENLFVFGQMLTAPGPKNQGKEFGTRIAQEGEAWSNVFIDATSWNFGKGESNGYSKDDLTSRLVNRDYFQIANTGWRDQTGKLYVTDAPTQFDSFVMTDKDLTFTEVDRVVVGTSHVDTVLRWVNNQTDEYLRSPTRLRIQYKKPRDYTSDVYPGVTWRFEMSFNDGPWTEGNPQTGWLICDGLTPNTSYDLGYRFTLQDTNPAFDVLSSNTYATKVYTTTKYADLPDTLDVKQRSATELEVTVPAGLYVQHSGAGGGNVKWYSPEEEKWKFSRGATVTNDQNISFNSQSADFRKLSSDTNFTITIGQTYKSPDPEHESTYSLFLMAKGSNQTDYKKVYSFKWKPQAIVPEAQIGSRTGTSLTLELLGDVPEGSLQVAIKIDGEWSDWQDSLSFDGLQPGTEYEIKLRTTETEEWFPSEEKVITAATKGIPEPPQTLPKVIDRTDTSLTIETADGQEYSIDGGKTWQTGGEFTGLSPSTEYQIISRYTETDDMLQSDASSPLTVSTKGIPTAEIVPPVITDVTETTITVEVVEGQEYALRYAQAVTDDPQMLRRAIRRTAAKSQPSVPGLVRDWTDTGEFTELTSNTKYEVITRLKETEDFIASDVGTASIEVKTKDTYKPPVTVTDTHTAYIYGYPDGTVRPESPITRAEVVEVLQRIYPHSLETVSKFSDVPNNEWYSASIGILTAAGKLKGYPDGSFRPTRAITRAEFISLVSRFATPTDTSSAGASFSDIAGNWAEESIRAAAAAGWIFGYPDGTFRPNQSITRAEAMTVLNRILERSPGQNGEEITAESPWSDLTNTGAWYYADVMESSVSHSYRPV